MKHFYDRLVPLCHPNLEGRHANIERQVGQLAALARIEWPPRRHTPRGTRP